MEDWISHLFQNEDLLRMGHCQRSEDLNLGMGWLYYGFTRLLRPEKIVVIGSWRGFSPLVFAKALDDNVEKGKLDFIDPSLVDDFWKKPEQIQQHFKNFNMDNINHHLMTTQDFVETTAYEKLDEIGVLFIDGMHTAEQARFDYEAFRNKIMDNGLIFFHDSIEVSKVNWLYGENKAYDRTVKVFIDELKNESNLQILDLPFAKGLTIVRKISNA